MSLKLRLLLLLRRWHGKIGVVAAMLVLFLAVTGIFLNHAAELKLNTRHIHTPWLVRWYGIGIETPTQGFADKETLLVGASSAWLLNDKVIAEGVPLPLGMVESNGNLYVAARDRLYLYSIDGVLVEKIAGSSLPALPVLAIGTARPRVMLQTASAVYSSEDGLNWEKASAAGVTWSQSVIIPSSERDRITALLSPAISAETLLSDIHSGRILGGWGPIFVDIIALALIGLAISGSMVFVRSHRRRHAVSVDEHRR